MKTYETVNIDSLQLVKESGDEHVFLCPFCEEKVEKKDTEGKLFFNIVKRCGWCFRCETVIFEEQEEKPISSAPRLITGYTSLLSSFSEEKSVTNLDPVAFQFPLLNEELLRYMENRNPFLPQLAEFLGLRGWVGKNLGIAVPFYVNNEIVSFQVRYVNRTDGAKYFTAPSAKPPYSPLQIFRPLEWKRQRIISLAEGIYDAVSLMCMGYPCPIAILGSSITGLQISFLRKLVPEIVYLCFDKKEISFSVKEVLKDNLPSCQKYSIISSQWERLNGDPEDFLRLSIKDNSDLYKQIKERLCKIVKNGN